jgi:hypothetical protein
MHMVHESLEEEEEEGQEDEGESSADVCMRADLTCLFDMFYSGPRIAGIDSISGGSHAAQCGGGG